VSIAIAAVIGYLLGAIPFGLIIGRVTRGIDIRDYGSHRTGATNALRTLGARAAAFVFILDVAKGVVAVLLARTLFGADPLVEWAAAVAGLAAVIGHNWSIFIGLTGGRGVATSTGALAALAPVALLILAPVVILIIWRTRLVSLGSISGSLLSPFVVAALALAALAPPPAVAYAAAAGLLVTAAHADNISRLRAGTERRIGQKETTVPNG
jgi:acyl phosphate:glycerol-3-phosphate acyltransferase